VVTVQRALEKSSDVAAVKLALKVGPDKFYSYMKSYGFGARSGIQLPSETRGLLRPPTRWGSTSIASLAIGHEIGVTPVQLVSMVSAIGNGGTYIPPSILLETQQQLKPGETMRAMPFHPVAELPSTLPAAAHRAISPLTSAKMRKMMEGIVLNGTGRAAALNGYSAAGKTGTAQKVDPATHTYSHTKHVASFAGFAPVNNPAISVAVIMDSPVGAQHGAAVSAPIFKEVAQQVLEYLGVPHDEPMKTDPDPATDLDNADSGTPDDPSDLQTLFAEVNNLPADDPLRNADSTQPAALSADGDPHGVSTTPVVPQSVIPTGAAKPRSERGTSSSSDIANKPDDAELHDIEPAPSRAPLLAKNQQTPGAPATTPAPPSENGTLITDAKHRVAVPSFTGASVRQVVERAGTVGLAVQLLGNGLAREQAPAAGTMVPLGTEIVVRFAR
jgi:cell division protein FtsI (penicillin-binding protein 3)